MWDIFQYTRRAAVIVYGAIWSFKYEDELQ